MMKRLPPPPPLPFEALQDLQAIEAYVEQALRDCNEFISFSLDYEKASRILRTSIVEALRVQLDYYCALPNYRAVWLPQLLQDTIRSFLGLFPKFTSGEQFSGEMLTGAAQGSMHGERG